MHATFSAGRSWGAAQSQVRLDGLVLSELTYAQDTAFPRHSHENGFLFFVLDGTQVEELRTSQRWHRKGTLTLHPPQEPHCHRIGAGGLRSLNVEFEASWLEANSCVSGVLHKAAHVDTRVFPSIALTADALYSELGQLDDVSPLAIEAGVFSLLAQISRSTSLKLKAKPHWLKKACDILHEGYSQPLSLKAIGASVGVHPVHLAREFHKEYRCTVAQYIRRLRVNAACDAIRGSEMPLCQVALNSGFADQAHFTRVFKRLLGLTPHQFRVRHRLR